MTATPQTLTADNFDDVIGNGMPILVDFWAGWCGPCKMMDAPLKELAAEYEGRMKIGKVDVDAESGLAQRYGVMSIPTMIIFVDGEAKGKLVGAQPKKAVGGAMDQFAL